MFGSKRANNNVQKLTSTLYSVFYDSLY